MSYPPRIPALLWQRVEAWLRDEWSLEQITDWLRRPEGVRLSHEWIYQFLYRDKAAGGDLYRHLRCQKQRKKRYGSYQSRGALVNQVSIEQRPAIVRLLCHMQHSVHTVTSDNGKGFAEHETIAQQLKAGFYFVHPYASWERSNSKLNSRVRRPDRFTTFRDRLRMFIFNR